MASMSTPLVALVAFLVGAALGALAAVVVAQTRARRLEVSSAQREEQVRLLEHQIEALQQTEVRLREAFKAMSADALKENRESFLGDAQRLVEPLGKALKDVQEQVKTLEGAREQAYRGLTAQLGELSQAQVGLRQETKQLVAALRSPTTRGRWGEVQLRRVVEFAGMVEYCDFVEQEGSSSAEGRIRPDMIIKLPNDRCVVVDAKAPLQAYLDALDAPTEEIREQKMVEHAKQVRDHLTALSNKKYWEQFDESPEFVVLFLPGESFYSAALEQDGSLIELGAQKRVILATPTTLIALLRSVAYGWNQEKLAENAQKISDLGQELYKRLRTMGGHFQRLGKSLNSSVKHFNDAAGSLQSRVVVQARRFEELGSAPGDKIEDLELIESQAVSADLPELDPGETPPPLQ
jgi:DNA recombination protein RmuC